METTISMSDAKGHFSEYISRAANGERFVIARRERPLAAIIGSGELERLERSAEIARRLAQVLGQSPQILNAIENGEVHPAMAAYGLWKDEEEFSNLDQKILQERRRTSNRADSDL